MISMDCVIDKKLVLRYLGYKGQDINVELQNRLDNIIEQCQTSLIPKYIYQYFEIDTQSVDEKGIHAVALKNTTMVLPGKSIARHLREASEVALIACTLGIASEQQLRKLSAIDPVSAMMYDAACSALIESAAEQIQHKIKQEALLHEKAISIRYSPGYGDFPLSLQPQILRVLKAEQKIGLTATDTNLLLPSKSITAVIGIGPTLA